MSAIGIIIDSEYIRRVKSKTFLLTTFLLPIGLVALMAILALVVGASMSSERTMTRAIAVFDPGGEVFEHLEADAPESFDFTQVSGSLDWLKGRVSNEEFDGLLVIPEGVTGRGQGQQVYLYTSEVQSLMVEQALSRFVLDVLRERRLERFDLPAEVYNAIRQGVDFRVMEIGEAGEAGRDATGRAIGLIGYGMGIAFSIFMLVTIYGGMVMQSVMEEKASRMAEILIACVRPFDLLMGKIIAIFCVALTQILVWILLFVVLAITAGVLVGLLAPADALGEVAGAAQALQSFTTNESVSMPDIRADVVLVTLAMLPIGYFLYASLFGGLGAAFENSQDAQMAMMLPMLPLILAIVMLQTIVLAPNSLFIKVGSLVPFTAPVIMPTRMLLSEVPTYEVLLSLLLSVAGAVACGWLAGRVFRVALLRYGQKTSIRELFRMVIGA